MTILAQTPTEWAETFTSAIDRYGTPLVVLFAIFVFGFLILRYLTMRAQQNNTVDIAQAHTNERIVELLGTSVTQNADNAKAQNIVNERVAAALELLAENIKSLSIAMPRHIIEEVKEVAQHNLTEYNKGNTHLAGAISELEKDGEAVKAELEAIKATLQEIVKQLSVSTTRTDEGIKRLQHQVENVIQQVGTMIDTQTVKTVPKEEEKRDDQ